MGSISRRSGESQYRIESQHVPPACPPVEDRDSRVDPSLVPTPTLDVPQGQSEERTPGREERTATSDAAKADEEKERRDLGDGSRSLASGGGSPLGLYRDSYATPVYEPFLRDEVAPIEPRPLRVYTDEQKTAYAKAKRAENYRRLQVARRWIEEECRDNPKVFTPTTLLGCGAAPHSGMAAIEVDGAGRVFHAHRRCKSWTCPQCAYAKALARADHIERALTAAFAKGWRALFVTFTIPHTAADSAHSLISALNKAYRSCGTWRAFRKLKDDYSFEGAVKAMDFTFTPNGCHVHLHCLFFFSYAGDVFDIYQAFRLGLPSIWDTAVFKRTGKHIHPRYGLNVEPVKVPTDGESAAAIAEYVAKVVSIYASKPDADKDRVDPSSLSPFQLLDDPENDRSRALYLDWIRGHHKKHRIEFSPGLSAKLAIPDSEFDMPDSVVLGGLSHAASMFLRNPDHVADFRRRLLANPFAAASWLDENSSPSNWYDEVLFSLSGVSLDGLPDWVDFHSTRPGDVVLDAPQEVSSLFVA